MAPKSDDPDYKLAMDALAATDVVVTDNDVPGISLVPASISATEAYAKIPFSVRLMTKFLLERG